MLVNHKVGAVTFRPTYINQPLRLARERQYVSVRPSLVVCSSERGARCTGAVPKHFYPFGNGTGDTMLAPDDMSMSDTIQLSRPFPYYGIQREEMWVGTSTSIKADGVVILNVTSDAT